ncbi:MULTISPECIES: heme-dependent oxidative N-demethylase family protein [Alphaproteobacteria]|uniref:DUF3445 domain-containing protein n=2 Tax=Alphaproteobacteria TaxID=28211 RepID=A0A512HL02_9HYPH|nr:MULTISPECIES: DUF3445 domain-containing protein [Alphaproteobacteria]GEO86080.1 hypothetical protein RNA01_30120 [Ciceribacter naphthalenivorans]GLR22167.1 hypothetical protein GCM10007920_19540 [Ciceribacter naphthalenivorans]GLT05023.1 hypothetical protein GCM10007926_19540 [Sphingomonas psychrolutea]
MPAYTPYSSNTSKPFAIGLSALETSRWIEPDSDLSAYLEEKRRLEAEHFRDIYRDCPESLDAQQECLDLLAAHLLDHHGDIYAREGSIMSMAGHEVDLADESRPPLLRAGSLVQDDLVILRKKADGWTIIAAHLAFPSSWSLAEKFMKPMAKVHAHVPGFQGGTRNDMMINRVFDNLQPDLPAERFNWSINWRYALYHPVSVRPSSDPASLGIDPRAAFVRVERQTLRKLPATGDLVFTIRIYLDPVSVFEQHPDGARMAQGLANQLEAMTEEQIDYKGLAEKRDDLLRCLRAGNYA